MYLLMNKFLILIFLLFLSSKLIANPTVNARTGILVDYKRGRKPYKVNSLVGNTPLFL